MAQIFQIPRQLVVSANYLPLNGAVASFFLSGTTTPTTVYQNAALTVAHGVTVTTDAAGFFPVIYLDASKLYKLELRDSGGALLPGYPIDPCNDLFPQSGNTLTSVTGTNTIQATLTPSQTLAAGLEVTIIPAATNTGAVTLELNTSGVLSAVVGPGRTALAGGELVLGLPAKLIFNTSSSWSIVNPANQGPKVVANVAGTNTITGTLNLVTLTGLRQIIVTPAATNTGATTINLDGLGAIAVQNVDGTACVGGELTINIPSILILNATGTAFIIVNAANSRLIRSQIQSGNYSFVSTDNGQIIFYGGAGAQTYTLANGVLANGSTILVGNDSSGSITIAQSGTMTLRWLNGSGAVSTGNRTLANAGYCSIYIFSATIATVTGTGLS